MVQVAAWDTEAKENVVVLSFDCSAGWGIFLEKWSLSNR